MAWRIIVPLSSGSCSPTNLYYLYVCYKFFQDMFIVHFHWFLHSFFPLRIVLLKTGVCGIDIRAHLVQVKLLCCMYLTLLHICFDGGGRDSLQNHRSFTLWFFWWLMVTIRWLSLVFWFSPCIHEGRTSGTWWIGGWLAPLARLYCNAVSLQLMLGLQSINWITWESGWLPARTLIWVVAAFVRLLFPTVGWC